MYSCSTGTSEIEKSGLKYFSNVILTASNESTQGNCQTLYCYSKYDTAIEGLFSFVVFSVDKHYILLFLRHCHSSLYPTLSLSCSPPSLSPSLPLSLSLSLSLSPHLSLSLSPSLSLSLSLSLPPSPSLSLPPVTLRLLSLAVWWILWNSKVDILSFSVSLLLCCSSLLLSTSLFSLSVPAVRQWAERQTCWWANSLSLSLYSKVNPLKWASIKTSHTLTLFF